MVTDYFGDEAAELVPASDKLEAIGLGYFTGGRLRGAFSRVSDF
jgi:hypothetical protein